MAVKRYYADTDTTIANAYKNDLTTKATGSNMGASDVLETFFIYGQASTSSVETARILIKFPTHDITADRAAGRIPAADSVDFYLRMYNADHALSLPKDFTLSVRPVTSNWQEGNGLDMEEYKDETYDLYEGANWTTSLSGSSGAGIGTAATAVDCIDIAGVDNSNEDASFTILIPTSTGGLGGTAVTFLLDFDQNFGPGLEAAAGANKIAIGVFGATDAQIAALVIKAINAETSDNIAYATSGNGEAADDLGITAKQGSSDTQITLTMDTLGADGNITSALTGLDPSGEEGHNVIDVTAFTGGSDLALWTTEGGDYETDSHAKSQTLTFPKGTEDLELNVTALVEEWVAGSRSNYGVGVHMTGSYEAGTRSYYTKKFFARSSEYFFKRPVIEARWDSTEKDERGNFYAKSNLLSSANNTNTLYFKNYFNGVLTTITGTPSLRANVYSDSDKSYQITNEAGTTYHAADSTGAYKDDVITDTALPEVYVEWVDSSANVFCNMFLLGS